MVQLDLMKGWGIRTDHIVAGYGGARHSGRGTLLDQQDSILHADIYRQPVAPAEMEQDIVRMELGNSGIERGKKSKTFKLFM